MLKLALSKTKICFDSHNVLVDGTICQSDGCVVKFYSFIENMHRFFKGQSDLWTHFW